MTEQQELLTETENEPSETPAAEPPEDNLQSSDTLSVIAVVEADERAYNLQKLKAGAMASSTMVPKQYQGKNNIPNVMIAMNMAARMNADPLMVMQNLYIVNGKPGWSAQFLIGCFNSCGRFTAIRYRFNDAGDECTATTTERDTGELIEGTAITLEMAKAEGWSGKSGSKWKTMPEQMLKYRAATFLIRSTAPEIGLGLYTKDELEDNG